MTSLMCQAHVVAGCRLRCLCYAAQRLSCSKRLDWHFYVTVSGQHSKCVKVKTAGLLEVSSFGTQATYFSPYSIGQSKSQGQPRFKRQKNRLCLDNVSCKDIMALFSLLFSPPTPMFRIQEQRKTAFKSLPSNYAELSAAY